MLARSFACALLLAGCGRVGFALHGDASGDGLVGDDAASIDTAPMIDAPPSACEQAWLDGTPSLSPPKLVTGLSTPDSERDPSLSKDRLTLWLARGPDLYVATRASLDADFANPVLDTAFDDPLHDSYKVSVRADGLEVFGSRLSAGASMPVDMFTARRTSTAEPWPAMTLAGDLSVAQRAYDPELSADGLSFYFAEVDLAGHEIIVVTHRPNVHADWGPITELAELTAVEATGDPSLTDDQRVIVFARSNGTIEFDLHVATRASQTGPFTNDIVVPGVNAADTDGDPTISGDGCQIYFTSRRTGNFEIYETHIEL